MTLKRKLLDLYKDAVLNEENGERHSVEALSVVFGFLDELETRLIEGKKHMSKEQDLTILNWLEDQILENK